MLLTTFNVNAKEYRGKLRCWDNNNNDALIPKYIDEHLNSETYLDENGRRSFIIDFSTKVTRGNFEQRGHKLHFGWSISECEDYSKFVFRRIDFDKVLNNKLKFTNVKYFYYHPDGQTIFRVLKCENFPGEINEASPVFKL